jgi:general secretion pathway protein D
MRPTEARLFGLSRALGPLIARPLVLLALCLAPAHAASPGESVAVDFEDIDLRVFIKFVSEATGRIFVVDERVQGRVSVRFADRIPVARLGEVLESVLEVKGYAAVPAGYITKIVPLSSVKQRGIEVRGQGAPSSSARR